MAYSKQRSSSDGKSRMSSNISGFYRRFAVCKNAVAGLSSSYASTTTNAKS